MGSWLDVDRFLTHVAVENALAEGDGIVGDQGLNNFYLYEYGAKNRFVFIPWDKDNTFRSGSLAALPQPRDERPHPPADRRPREAPGLRRRGGARGELYVNPRWLTPQLETAYQQIRPAVQADTASPSRTRSSRPRWTACGA